MKLLSTLLSSGLFGMVGLIHADPITYTYTPISVPGGSFTVARGINNAGEIVGAYNDSTGQGHGFIYNNGVYTTVDAPGGTATTLLGVNNLGQIVGSYVDSSNTPRLFLNNNGAFTTIDPPRGLVPSHGEVASGPGVAAGINDLGQIVSTSSIVFPPPYNGSSNVVGFLYNQGQFTTIPSLTGLSITSYYATGINNAGQITFTTSSNDTRPAVWSNGQLTQLPVIGNGSGASTDAIGINNVGNIVGNYSSNSPDPSLDIVGAYIYSGGVVTTFDIYSSPNLYRIFGINDAGQLIGRGLSGAVLATPTTAPVPEPGSFLLLGCGLSGLAFIARSRTKQRKQA